MIIVRCENTEGIYTPRMAYESYEDALAQCNSIGMGLIKNLNFSKFRGFPMKIFFDKHFYTL